MLILRLMLKVVTRTILVMTVEMMMVVIMLMEPVDGEFPST
jgi:hypothetical protein